MVKSVSDSSSMDEDELGCSSFRYSAKASRLSRAVFAGVADAMTDVAMALTMAIDDPIIPQPILISHLIPFLTHRDYPAKHKEKGYLFQSRGQMWIISARALYQLT